MTTPERMGLEACKPWPRNRPTTPAGRAPPAAPPLDAAIAGDAGRLSVAAAAGGRMGDAIGDKDASTRLGIHP